jgi:hypothetical protein
LEVVPALSVSLLVQNLQAAVLLTIVSLKFLYAKLITLGIDELSLADAIVVGVCSYTCTIAWIKTVKLHNEKYKAMQKLYKKTEGQLVVYHVPVPVVLSRRLLQASFLVFYLEYPWALQAVIQHLHLPTTRLACRVATISCRVVHMQKPLLQKR